MSCSEVSFPFPSTLHQQDLPNPDKRKPASRKRSCYNLQPQEDHLVIMDNDLDKEKKKKKMVHRETEKKRRQEMSKLSSSLRSLFPLHFIKGTRSMCEHVNQAVSYIKHLEEKIKELKIKSDKLKKMCNVVTDGKAVLQKNDKSERVMVECSWNPITVTVNCSEGGIEILVKSFINENKGLQISRVLKTLVQEGIDVISCNSTKVNDRLLIYTIHSKGRKMELSQALVKMDHGGSAEGILQVCADRIQSDLEELLKALTERCKKHGIDVKSTAVIELPKGWQPGVPDISAVWDEDWDKFEDEGFSFDATVPANAKSTSQAENSAPMDDVSEDSYSNADRKLEKPFETESTYAHSEDESAKSPAGSPTAQKIFESPTKEDSFNHFGKSFAADTERGFDDQGWGTFDNNDDVDSVWGFNSSTAKDAEHEKHGESYFFDSSSFTASPRKSDSPQGSNSFFQKKSPFGFDDSVPGSPASRAGTSPRYSGGGAENSFFDNFSRYDSFSATDRGSPKQETFSRFDSMSSSTQDNNFSRFDSMSSTAQDRSFARFDSMSSNAGFDHGHTYSFDDSDPFGSSGPFKVSSESQTGKNETDKWAF